MARPRAPFAAMPLAARGFLIAVLAVAAAVAAVALGSLRGGEPWSAFAILALSSAAAQLFVVRAERNQAYHTTLAFLVPAAVLLPPPLVVLLVLCQHLPEVVRERYRWYIACFNVANYTLDTLAAGAAYRLVHAGAPAPEPTAAVAAAIVLVLANHGLLAVMLRLGRGHSFRASGLFTRTSLAVELAPALVGVMLLVRVSPSDPWLLPAAILPLFFLSRSMTVPALHRAEAMLKARSTRQSHLIELGRAAMTSDSVDDVVARALELARSCLRMDGGYLIELAHGDVAAPCVRTSAGAHPIDLEAELLAGPSAYALVVGEPVSTADYALEGRFRAPQLGGDVRPGSGICVAVPGSSGPIGALTLLRGDAGELGADDIEFLQSVVMTIAVTIERASSAAALARSEERREELLGDMLRAEEEERLRIATELHDDTIQVMTATLMRMDSLERSVRRDDGTPEALRALGRARSTLADAVERTRRLTFELRPPLLEANGLACAIEELAEQVGREAGFAPAVATSLGRYSTTVEDLTYRIMQEAIANVRKHARARHVAIELRERGGRLHGLVADDGVGFEVETALDRHRMRLHLGLDALIERVKLAGGSVEIHSQPGRGSRLSFSLPLPATSGVTGGQVLLAAS